MLLVVVPRLRRRHSEMGARGKNAWKLLLRELQPLEPLELLPVDTEAPEVTNHPRFSPAEGVIANPSDALLDLFLRDDDSELPPSLLLEDGRRDEVVDGIVLQGLVRRRPWSGKGPVLGSVDGAELVDHLLDLGFRDLLPPDESHVSARHHDVGAARTRASGYRDASMVLSCITRWRARRSVRRTAGSNDDDREQRQ